MPTTNALDGSRMPAGPDPFDPVADLVRYQNDVAPYNVTRVYADATEMNADTYAADGWIGYTDDTAEFWGRSGGSWELLRPPKAFIELADNADFSVGTSLTTVSTWATEVRKEGFASHASGVITTPYTGWYTLTYEYRAAVGSISNTSAAFLINGSTLHGHNRSVASVSGTRVAASTTVYLASGATIALQISRDSSGAVSERRFLALLVRD